LPGRKRMIRSMPNAGGGEEDSAAGSGAFSCGVSEGAEMVSETGGDGGLVFATEVTLALAGAVATGAG